MSTKRGLIQALAIGMLGAGVACTAPGATNAAAQCQSKGQGFGGRCMAELAQLNLTPDQSREIESIMQLNREALKAAMTTAKEARAALNRQVQSGPFDEQSVRDACRKAAAAGEEAAVLRAKVAGKVHTVLTSEQRAVLDKLRADAQGKMRKRFAGKHGRMGE